MSNSIFLFTPPFTQLNTPYPATAYLKGFLKTKNIDAFQADLGMEVTLKLFSKKGLQELFAAIPPTENFSTNAKRMMTLQNSYMNTIENVIHFLQGKSPTLSNLIAKRNFLPEAERFQQVDDLNWAFGSMGVQDKAKHLATLYLEDISDLIKECVDPHFGFSRYAEKLGRSANSFDEIYEELQNEYSFIDKILIEVLKERMNVLHPKLVCISVPFPGNLYASLRCGQWIKKNFPKCKIAMGGGFANTELRSLTDERVFEFYDFITLDDGEAPVENLIKFVDGNITVNELKRTFTMVNGRLQFINNNACADYKQGEVGTPDYSDFLLDQYISAIEVANPMHSLWSDGRWNKLTMAHGCYWGKCTFCDISLDYIKLYEPITADLLCNRIEEIIAQTGHNGFHFVDEAAPPALMKALSLEIIKRKLVVVWWANIRFEKSFTRDLCILLKMAGCIAVSGGLEVASDRLLKLIDKGITVAQVAKVNQYFTEAGIMVHAYLMYGFPTQTAQETIDSLEMVRQMFKTGVLHSAFWHLFTMTAHSPVGLNPEKYKVQKVSDSVGSFANNDIEHIDPTGAEHISFGYGLKKSLINYMHAACIDEPLHKWFDFKTPRTTIPSDHIEDILSNDLMATAKPNARVVWLGNFPHMEFSTKSKKGIIWEVCSLRFDTLTGIISLKINKDQGLWLVHLIQTLTQFPNLTHTYKQLQDSYMAAGLEDFELFWYGKQMKTIGKVGLLII